MFYLIPIACVILAAALYGVWFVFLRTKKSKTVAIENRPLFGGEKNFANRIKNLLTSAEDVSQQMAHLEEVLLTADIGIGCTEKLMHQVFGEHSPKNGKEAMDLLKQAMIEKLTPKNDFTINTDHKPFVIYLVGVNGVGKTTTIGKLAQKFKNQGHTVMLLAADTFRAAAVQQLRLWSEKNGVAFSGGSDGMDPSAAIVDGLRAAVAQKIDVVLVDTAGRLHTKSNLMEELKKMVRMSEKVLTRKPDEIWLVVDSVSGQNGFQQAKIFCDAIELTGVILTKYDATAKGGIILSIREETGLPIRFVGLGEGIDDLQAFDSHNFIQKIFSNT